MSFTINKQVEKKVGPKIICDLWYLWPFCWRWKKNEREVSSIGSTCNDLKRKTYCVQSLSQLQHLHQRQLLFGYHSNFGHSVENRLINYLSRMRWFVEKIAKKTVKKVCARSEEQNQKKKDLKFRITLEKW